VVTSRSTDNYLEGPSHLNAAAIVANVVGWPVLQLSIAFISLRLPERLFASHQSTSQSQLLEASFYRAVLQVRKWKHLLPDGASWIGGSFSKRRLKSHSSDYLLRFAAEARRGEIAHWCMLACFPVFYFWNPPWACAVITLYACATNVPCIIVQRYNRFVILQGLKNRTTSYMER
jgi:glycosyl-4,4'-diaponeurosporenoate acyltransferase